MEKYNEPAQYSDLTSGIILAGHFQVDDSYVTNRPEGMEDWLITYTLEGSGYFAVPGEKRTCTSGDIVLLRAGTPHTYGTTKGEAWNFVWAHFSPRSIGEKLLPDEPLSLQALEQGSLQTRIYEAFRRILFDSRERSEYWHDLCLNSLREILMLLAERQSRKLDSRVAEAMRFLSEHMRSPVQIEALSKEIGLSPSRLSHLFKEQTGVSVIDALNRMRIRQATLLLAHTDRSASEVAYDVGFHNYNHFMNQFRKWTGTNPSAFRKQERTDGG